MILFLAANPVNTTQLALDHEVRAIHFELRRSGYRKRSDFVTWWAIEPLDLLRELNDAGATIVYFSGHGARPGPTAEPTSSRDVVAVDSPCDGDPGGPRLDPLQVVSLWSVADASSPALMHDYYAARQCGIGHVELLRQAKRRFLQQSGYAHPGYAHPFYWVAFIPAGDSRPLEATAFQPHRCTP